jgi:hypothetical protein
VVDGAPVEAMTTWWFGFRKPGAVVRAFGRCDAEMPRRGGADSFIGPCRWMWVEVV